MRALGKKELLFVNKKKQKNFESPVVTMTERLLPHSLNRADCTVQKRSAFLLLALLLPALAHADDATETALRAALANSTTQIANLEDQVANLQPAEAPHTAMIEALNAQAQLLQKGGAAPGAPGAASSKDMLALKHKLAAKEAALAKSQAAYTAAAADAAAKAAANAQLTKELTAMTAEKNVCDTKNAALFTLGNQILDAYAQKDNLFHSISNRDLFIGFKRVQLENLVQTDQQTMLDNELATSP